MTPDRLPPHNRDAERSVLGSMLRDNACIADVLRHVRADDFYRDAHRKAFAALVALWDAAKPADLVTLAAELARRGDLGDAGGPAYLAELWDAAPTAANACHYAALVKDKALLRGLVHATTEILREAYEPTAAPRDALAAAEARIFAVSSLGADGSAVELRGAVDEAFERLDARRAGRGRGLPTGFADLDDRTAGLHGGDLVVVGARPSVGKTACCLAVLHRLCVQGGEPCFFASLEQSRVEVAERLLCLESGVNSYHVRHGRLSAAEQDALGRAYDVLQPAPLFLDDGAGQDMLRIASNARRLKARHGIRAVFVDYLQLVEPGDRQAKRHEQVAETARRLKQLARELSVPVVALAQVSREVERRGDGRPRLSDLRESGDIEASADVVILMHRPGARDDAPREPIDLIVAKQRNGPTGELTLLYEKACYRFHNHAPGM